MHVSFRVSALLKTLGPVAKVAAWVSSLGWMAVSSGLIML